MRRSGVRIPLAPPASGHRHEAAAAFRWNHADRPNGFDSTPFECGYFVVTLRPRSSPRRSGGARVPQGGLGGSEWPSAASWAFRTGASRGLGGDAARRPRPPACGVVRRRRPRPRAPVKSPVSWCGGVFAVFSRRVRGAGSAPSVTTCPRSGAGPQRPGGSSAGRVPVAARGRGMWSSPSPPRPWAFCTFGAGLMGSGRGAWGSRRYGAACAASAGAAGDDWGPSVHYKRRKAKPPTEERSR